MDKKQSISSQYHVPMYDPLLVTANMNLLGAKPFLRSCQLCSHSRISQHFVEPEDSLPSSQELSTGPYPEPDQSSPYHYVKLSLCLTKYNIVDVCIHVFLTSAPAGRGMVRYTPRPFYPRGNRPRCTLFTISTEPQRCSGRRAEEKMLLRITGTRTLTPR
jgi:hypothetical protein